MTLSENQGKLLKTYLIPQLELQGEIFAQYKVEVSFNQLLDIQLSEGDKLKNLMIEMLDQMIKKSKNVKDKVLAKLATYDEDNQSKWMTLL